MTNKRVLCLGPCLMKILKAWLIVKDGFMSIFRIKMLAARIAGLMQQEKVIGLCQGRMEFGPRALGARSIIGDARSEKMQSDSEFKGQIPRIFQAFRAQRIGRKSFGIF